MAITINACHGTYNRSQRSTTDLIKNFAVHYTGGTGSAKNNCLFFGSGNRKASADFFIDKDGAIWEYNNPFDGHYTWHCGDGGGKYGITNTNSIGVEVVSNGEDFTPAQIVALSALYDYVCQVLGRKLTVVRHYDASRKHCPAPYVDPAKWGYLKPQIGNTAIVTTTPSQAVTVPTSASTPASEISTTFSSWLSSLQAECKAQGFVGYPCIRYGSRGGVTRHLQVRLNTLGFDCGAVDGIFGSKTKAAVEAFQRSRNIADDGIVGAITWSQLCVDSAKPASPTKTRATVRNGSTGQDVRELQTLLNKLGYSCGKVDGIFGAKTEKAVRAYQRDHGLADDGIAGPLTWGKMLR